MPISASSGAGVAAARPAESAGRQGHDQQRRDHQATLADRPRPLDGAPINQQDQALPLPTFGQVIPKGMRALGLKLSNDDDEAWQPGVPAGPTWSPSAAVASSVR